MHVAWLYHILQVDELQQELLSFALKGSAGKAADGPSGIPESSSASKEVGGGPVQDASEVALLKGEIRTLTWQVRRTTVLPIIRPAVPAVPAVFPIMSCACSLTLSSAGWKHRTFVLLHLYHVITADVGCLLTYG
jgi:hypothetical protein